MNREPAIGQVEFIVAVCGGVADMLAGKAGTQVCTEAASGVDAL